MKAQEWLNRKAGEVVQELRRFKSIGSPYGTTSAGVVLNRANRRAIAHRGGTRLERMLAREESVVAKLELSWRLRKLTALRALSGRRNA